MVFEPSFETVSSEPDNIYPPNFSLKEVILSDFLISLCYNRLEEHKEQQKIS
jgi:hypothetical protein